MSIQARIGDIYRVSLNDNTTRFIHYIAKDKSDLHSDVIRIFRRHYSIDEMPTVEMVLTDEVECHMHTFVRYALKWGLWQKYAFAPVRANDYVNVVFRSSRDEGKYPKQKVVSKDWEVWRINGRRISVGILPEQYHRADIGGVYSPNHVIQRLLTVKEPCKFYPDY